MNFYTFLLDLLMKVRPTELRDLIKRFLRIKYRVVNLNQYKVWVDPTTHFGYRVFRYGCYEPEATSMVNSILEEGDTFIDVGANEGWYTIVAGKKVGQKGRVISIEPQKRVWPIIQKNLELNSLKNNTLLPFGISDKCELKELIITPSLDTGIATFVNLPRFSFHKREKIELKTLDWVCEHYQIDRIKLIKIDIEGYEVYAVRSAKKLLSSKKIKNLYIEFHPSHLKRLNHDPSEIYDLLKKYGYYIRNVNGADIFTVI